MSSIGDVLLASHVLRLLKIRYPGADIDFLVKDRYADLIKTNPYISRVLEFHSDGGSAGLRRIIRIIRDSRYDGIIDLHSNIRSRLITALSGTHAIQRYRNRRWARFMLVLFRRDVYPDALPVPMRYLEALEAWGVMDDGRGLELVLPSESHNSVNVILEEAGCRTDDRIMVLSPGASRATKRWFPERFAEVGDYFASFGYRIVLTGGRDDVATNHEVAQRMDKSAVDLTGRTTLIETAALIGRARLLITHDTGVMHIGVAVGTPLVALFGPTTYHLGFFPFRASSVVVEKEIPCRPCSYHGTARCPKGHFHCMKDIGVEDVIQAADSLLENN